MNRSKIISLILVMLLLGAAALADAPVPAQVGLEAPDFELETLDGDTFKLSDWRGKVVFLNLWATWCPPCVAEMSDIQALSEAHPDDLVVVGVSLDDSETDAYDFITEHGYSYIFAMDRSYEVSGRLFPTYAIPNSIYIDPDGVVTSMDLGSVDYEVMEQRYLAAKAHAAE